MRRAEHESQRPGADQRRRHPGRIGLGDRGPVAAEMHCVDRLIRGGGEIDPLQRHRDVDLGRSEVAGARRQQADRQAQALGDDGGVDGAVRPGVRGAHGELDVAQRHRPLRQRDQELRSPRRPRRTAGPAPRTDAEGPSPRPRGRRARCRWLERKARRSKSLRDLKPSTPRLNDALSVRPLILTGGAAVLADAREFEAEVGDLFLHLLDTAPSPATLVV